MKSESVVYYHYQKAFILESSVTFWFFLLNAEKINFLLEKDWERGGGERQTDRQTERGMGRESK